MSSSHEPIYWDTTQHTLAAPLGPATQTTYSLSFPQGTTRWQIINLDAVVSPEIAGTLATITTALGPAGVPPLTLPSATRGASTWNVAGGAGSVVFIRNRNPGTVLVQISWERVGRQPNGMDPGTVTISGDITP